MYKTIICFFLISLSTNAIFENGVGEGKKYNPKEQAILNVLSVYFDTIRSWESQCSKTFPAKYWNRNFQKQKKSSWCKGYKKFKALTFRDVYGKKVSFKAQNGNFIFSSNLANLKRKMELTVMPTTHQIKMVDGYSCGMFHFDQREGIMFWFKSGC